MWIDVLDRGLQCFERLLVFAGEDPFERFGAPPTRTNDIEIGALLMVLAVVGSACGILAKILL